MEVAIVVPAKDALLTMIFGSQKSAVQEKTSGRIEKKGLGKNVTNDQLNIKEYAQSLELLEVIKQDVLNGEIMSLLIIAERVDGQFQGGTTATQNVYGLAGNCLSWALRRMGFTTFQDVRMMGDKHD